MESIAELKEQIAYLTAENEQLKQKNAEYRHDLKQIVLTVHKILDKLGLFNENGAFEFSPRRFSKAMVKISSSVLQDQGSEDFLFIREQIPLMEKYEYLKDEAAEEKLNRGNQIEAL